MKILFVILGTLSLSLGILGIILPVLPSTPFFLLTAYLYLKGSKRLYEKLMSHPKLGPYIRNFQENKAIPLKTKIIAVSMLWITIGISALAFVSSGWIKLLLLAVAIGVTIHILSFKTLK